MYVKANHYAQGAMSQGAHLQATKSEQLHGSRRMAF